MPDANPRYQKVPRPESVKKLADFLRARSFIVQKIDSQHLKVERPGMSTLLVHMSNIYIFSYSDFEDALGVNPNIDVIVSMSAWNSYTKEVKENARAGSVGVFSFVEFLGAVNFDGQKFLNYKPKR
jgi:hypothetical protein